MANIMKSCRVCGKMYETCRTFKPSDGTFRWQDVSCCPEHGVIYLEKVMAMRAKEKMFAHAVSDDASDKKEDVVSDCSDNNVDAVSIKKSRKRIAKVVDDVAEEAATDAAEESDEN